MITPLAQQIASRMRARNLSINTLEREAGVKTHAVRNILRGNSKRPSAEVLHAIAQILKCTVKDLLEDQVIFQGQETEESKNNLLNTSYKQKDLFLEIVSLVNKKITEKKIDITIQQLLNCIQEIYLHSLQQNPPNIDLGFAEWFIELLEE